MLKIKILVILVVLMASCAPQVQKSSLPISREAECLEAVGSSYKYLSWGFGANNAEAETDAMKCAVYTAMARTTGKCSSIMSTEEIIKAKEFFENYFKNEDWKMYVENTNRGRIDPGKRLKTEDGSVKLGLEIIVRTLELEEYLIAKKLTRKKSQYGG